MQPSILNCIVFTIQYMVYYILYTIHYVLFMQYYRSTVNCTLYTMVYHVVTRWFRGSVVFWDKRVWSVCMRMHQMYHSPKRWGFSDESTQKSTALKCTETTRERENEKVFVQRQNFQQIISKSERWGLGPKSETLKLQAEII